jgi:hypothetical protein
VSNDADDSFADRIGFRAARRRFHYRDSESSHRFIEVRGKDAIAIVQQVLVSLLGSRPLRAIAEESNRRSDVR